MINDICIYNIIIFYDVSFRRKIHQMAGNKIFLIQIYLFHKHKHRAKVYLSNQLSSFLSGLCFNDTTIVLCIVHSTMHSNLISFFGNLKTSSKGKSHISKGHSVIQINFLYRTVTGAFQGWYFLPINHKTLRMKH